MDRRCKVALWLGVAAWFLAGLFLALSLRIGFIISVWTIPVTLVLLGYWESRHLALWQGRIPFGSSRGISYGIAFLANTYWPVASALAFQSVAGLLQQIIFALYLIACLGLWVVLLFFSGGKQPSMAQGRFVPLLYCLMGFSLALFL